MTCGFFGSTADKGSEVDCSHKVNPRSLLAVARRADFASSRRIWLRYSSISVKDGRLCVSSRTRSTIIPCWKWPNLSRPPNKRNGSVSGNVNQAVSFDRHAQERGSVPIWVGPHRTHATPLMHSASDNYQRLWKIAFEELRSTMKHNLQDTISLLTRTPAALD